jgi:predicted DNA-binding transcriptional regulator AlpA
MTDAPKFGADGPGRPVSLTLSIDASSVQAFVDLLRKIIDPSALAQLPADANKPSQIVPLRPSTALTTGVDLKPDDRVKAADLRIALLTGKLPENAGLLIDGKTLAKLLSVSRAMLYRLLAEEALPPPVKLGRLTKWRLTEVLEWIEADCPPQDIWIARRRDWSKRKGK